MNEILDDSDAKITFSTELKYSNAQSILNVLSVPSGNDGVVWHPVFEAVCRDLPQMPNTFAISPVVVVGQDMAIRWSLSHLAIGSWNVETREMVYSHCVDWSQFFDFIDKFTDVMSLFSPGISPTILHEKNIEELYRFCFSNNTCDQLEGRYLLASTYISSYLEKQTVSVQGISSWLDMADEVKAPVLVKNPKDDWKVHQTVGERNCVFPLQSEVGERMFVGQFINDDMSRVQVVRPVFRNEQASMLKIYAKYVR